MLTYISDTAHYKDVLSHVPNVKHNLWIGTADIKDFYVEVGKQKKPFLAVLASLIRRGVEVRLVHAKEPGPNFREDFDKYPVLYDRLERVLCPHVHFKMLVFDCKEVYIGSANLTGAGIGMKTDNKRNFEAGILTDDPEIVEQAFRPHNINNNAYAFCRVVTEFEELKLFELNRGAAKFRYGKATERCNFASV